MSSPAASPNVASTCMTTFVAEAQLPAYTLYDAGQAPWLKLRALTQLILQTQHVDADLNAFANTAQTTEEPTCQYVNGDQAVNFYGFGLLAWTLCDRYKSSPRIGDRLKTLQDNIHAVAAQLFAPRHNWLARLFPKSAPLAQPYVLKTSQVATATSTAGAAVAVAKQSSVDRMQATEHEKIAVRKHVPIFQELVFAVADDLADAANAGTKKSRKRARTTEPGQCKEDDVDTVTLQQLGLELAWTLPVLMRQFPSKYPKLEPAGRFLMSELRRDDRWWISQLCTKQVSLETFRTQICGLQH